MLLNVIQSSRILRNTSDDGGGGSGTIPQPVTDPAAAFQRLLEKFNNDGLRLASQLFDENFQYRTTIRELKAQRPEGSLVLSPDEAKDYNKIKKLMDDGGIDAKGLKETLEKIPALEQTARELSGMENLRELAEVGLDGSKLKVSVLKDLVQGKYPDAEYRFTSEKDKDGNDIKNAYIKPSKDGQETTFSDFARQNLSDYLPALKVTAEQVVPPTGATPDPSPAGTNNSFFDGIRKQVEAENKAAAAGNANPMARFGRSEQTQSQ